MKHVVTALAALLIATTANAQEYNVRTISVTGMAERKIVPDEAHLNINLNSQEVQLANAKAAHDAKLAKLIAIVRGAGIEEKKIATQSSSTQPIYEYVNDAQGHSQRLFKGYRVQTTLDVTVTDTTRLSDLMDQISGAGFEKGANTEWGNLMNMYYTVSNPEQIKEEMLIDAIANAKAKANRMAIAAGASLSRVHQITEGGTPVFQPRPMMMMAKGGAMDMRAEAAAIAPPAGEQELQSSVTVVYEIQ
jgi:uncharacterized protein YggE